jgi:uncharacterized protein YndB with AHSA1/START domain
MTKSESNYEVLIERRFSASRETVFDSWANASEIAGWFAVPPFVVTAVDWMPSDGSPWRVDFGSPSGSTYWEEGFFLEVRPPEKLVFSLTQVGLPERRPETLVTVTFKVEGETETLMNFRQTGFGSVENRDGNTEGWESCFDALVRRISVRRATAQGADWS